MICQLLSGALSAESGTLCCGGAEAVLVLGAVLTGGGGAVAGGALNGRASEAVETGRGVPKGVETGRGVPEAVETGRGDWQGVGCNLLCLEARNSWNLEGICCSWSLLDWSACKRKTLVSEIRAFCSARKWLLLSHWRDFQKVFVIKRFSGLPVLWVLLGFFSCGWAGVSSPRSYRVKKERCDSRSIGLQQRRWQGSNPSTHTENLGEVLNWILTFMCRQVASLETIQFFFESSL